MPGSAPERSQQRSPARRGLLQTGSLKAELCVRGKAAMEQFAIEYGIRYATCGKLIVALDSSELVPRDLEARGRANGVPGLRMVGPREMAEIEPHAAGIRACTCRAPASSTSAGGRGTDRQLVAAGVDSTRS